MSLPGLAEALDDLAARGATVNYGDLARCLSISGPGSIARLTQALEALMDEDAAAGQPLRAVLCEARLGSGLPAPGFFDLARRLGRFDGVDPVAFVKAERAALFGRASHSLETGRPALARGAVCPRNPDDSFRTGDGKLGGE